MRSVYFFAGRCVERGWIILQSIRFPLPGTAAQVAKLSGMCHDYNTCVGMVLLCLVPYLLTEAVGFYCGAHSSSTSLWQIRCMFSQQYARYTHLHVR